MSNATENQNLCGLNRKDFQTTINGKKTDLYILKNRKGYEVAVSNYGGAIVAIAHLKAAQAEAVFDLRLDDGELKGIRADVVALAFDG